MSKKESGKMFVSGKGEIIIQMKVRKPSHVEVFFIDHPVPCDGNKHDHLEYKVHKHMFDHNHATAGVVPSDIIANEIVSSIILS
jgi:hypothetical protein